jgi:hypothetical protein
MIFMYDVINSAILEILSAWTCSMTRNVYSLDNSLRILLKVESVIHLFQDLCQRFKEFRVRYYPKFLCCRSYPNMLIIEF